MRKIEFILLSFLVVGLGYLFVFSPQVGVLGARQEKYTSFPSINFNVTPTEEPIIEVTPINNYNSQVKSSNAVGTIDCVGPDGKHFQTTQKECDDFNNAWRKPQTQTTNNQRTQSANNQTQQYQTTQPSTAYDFSKYPPCTITYPYSGTKTYYYLTAEYCKNAQQEAASITQVSPIPTTATVPTNSQDLSNNNVQQCQSNVTYKYQSLLQSCNQYGGSSARDACIQLYTNGRQQEYNACGGN